MHIYGTILSDENTQIEAVPGPPSGYPTTYPTVSIRIGSMSILVTVPQANQLSRDLGHTVEAILHDEHADA